MHWRRKWHPTPVFFPGEPRDREPGGLPSLGSHRVGHDWSNLAAAAALLLFSLKVFSDSLWPHALQQARLPGPSLSPGVCSNSCTLSQWSYLTISFSAILFSICLQSFQGLESFPKSQLFASGGQSTGASLQHQSFQWIFRTDFL